MSIATETRLHTPSRRRWSIEARRAYQQSSRFSRDNLSEAWYKLARTYHERASWSYDLVVCGDLSRDMARTFLNTGNQDKASYREMLNYIRVNRLQGIYYHEIGI